MLGPNNSPWPFVFRVFGDSIIVVGQPLLDILCQANVFFAPLVTKDIDMMGIHSKKNDPVFLPGQVGSGSRI